LTQKARKDKSLQRDCSCFWIDDIKTLVDCPETVGNSANKAGIAEIQNLFITHWHPDHCF
jgi:ribonuclease BN (tRNA processing enzyme)